MSDDRFVSFFRMTRESFTALGAVISTDPIFHNASHNPQVSPLIQLATALYFLGSFGGSTVRGAAQLGIGEGTAHLYLHRTIIALARLFPRYVRWPSPQSPEFRSMRSSIEQESHFPGCVGFLDGTDMVLQYSPSYHGESYFNRKKRYGFNVQGICDNDRRFTFIQTGFPASVGDATVFCQTTFFTKPNNFFARPEEYVLADKAYRITRRCMTPYREPLASRVQGGYKEFNRHHAEARVKIEHAFGVLKNRWRSLRGIPLYIRESSDHKRAVCWIMACILVHNFLCDYEDDLQWQLDNEGLEGQREERGNTEDMVDEPLCIQSERQAGVEWRNRMRSYFLEE